MMKAASLTQAWASLMALDEKRYETRGPTFPRRHLGELAIAASANFPLDCRSLVATEPFKHALMRHGIGSHKDLPLGAILCVVEVVAYVDAEKILPRDMPICASWSSLVAHVNPAEFEHHFGDYSAGRTIILTRNVRRLREPVPCKGMLGIWTVPSDVEAKVRAQLQ